MAKKSKQASIIQHQHTDSNGEVTISTEYGEVVIDSPVVENPVTKKIEPKKAKEFVGFHPVNGEEVYL